MGWWEVRGECRVEVVEGGGGVVRGEEGVIQDGSAEPARADNPVTLERIGAATALIASFSLAMSFAYDWGFFSALGITFADAPTSVSDHLRSWLVWLPKVVLGAFVFLGLELLTRRIEHGKTEAELIEGSSNPAKTKKQYDRSRRVITAVFGIIIIVWLVVGHVGFPWLAAAVCWMSFIAWVFGHPIVKQRHSPAFRLFAFVGPPLLLYFYSAGFRSAAVDPLGSTAQVELHGDSIEGKPVVAHAHLLRSFENWLLVREAAGTIRWIRSDQVHGIEVSGETKPFLGLLCIFLRVCIDHEEDRSSSSGWTRCPYPLLAPMLYKYEVYLTRDPTRRDLTREEHVVRCWVAMGTHTPGRHNGELPWGTREGTQLAARIPADAALVCEGRAGPGYAEPDCVSHAGSQAQDTARTGNFID